jgi:AraC-like DNA-binding protein
MSTATFTDPTPPAETLTLPLDLWAAYRDERRMGSKQREATSHAFQQFPAYTKSDTRERLAREMIAREAEQGLVLTDLEREAELLAEAASVEGVDVEPEPGSADAIERDAVQTIQQLRARIEQRAPEALTDAKLAAEQEADESELAAQERKLQNVTRARVEIARRTTHAEQEAERERRENAAAQAAEMVPKVAALKAAVDRAAGAWVTAVVELRDAQEQHAAFVSGATGGDAMAVRSVRFRDGDVAGALRASLQGRIRLDGLGTGSFRETLLVPAEREG